jgi:hypothetical protein
MFGRVLSMSELYTVMLDKQGTLLACKEDVTTAEEAKKILGDYLRDALEQDAGKLWIIFWNAWTWKMVHRDTAEEVYFGTIVKGVT